MKKQKLRHLNKPSWRIIVPIAVIVIGCATLLLTKAAQPTTSFEAESGNNTGSAQKFLSDSTASNRGYIKFGSNSNINRLLVNAPYFGAGLNWPKAGVNYQTSYNTHVQRVGNKKPSMLRTFGTSLNGVWNWNNIVT